MYKIYFESVFVYVDRKMLVWLLVENMLKIEIKLIDRKDFEKIIGIDLFYIVFEIKGLFRKFEYEM